MRLGYAIVGVALDGVQTMQQWWWWLVVTCGECLCLVMRKCGTVWRLWCGPSPAQPCHTIPSNPARALVNAVGELLATSSLLLAPLPLADCALFTGSHSAAIFTFIEDYHQLPFQN